MRQIETTLDINLAGRGEAFNRFFLEGIGSCHAYLTLREDWREHARLVQQEIGFKSMRAHGIFHDLVGIYQVWPRPGYNFQNLDKIYDFWLSQGLKPYVELSFMPRGLASGEQTLFAYQANVTPPNDLQAWSALIQAFTGHLIERYGLSEVLTWSFEVWNEPDLRFFWGGDQRAYFDLYAATARAIKSVDSRLRVGGPATAGSHWVAEMLDFCASNAVPIDFLSTHHYCADADLLVGETFSEIRWRGQKAMPADVRRTRDKVRSSRLPCLEIHYTEWNVSPAHEDRYGKDSEFTAAFVLQTIKDVAGLADRYMLWAISDVFEESGPGDAPFSGKYGLVSLHGIKKPVFHAFAWLSRMFDESLPAGDSAFITRSAGGTLRVLSWNYNEPLVIDLNGGDYLLDTQEKAETIRLAGYRGRCRVRAWRVDGDSGNAYRTWQAIGCPQYLTAAQVDFLKVSAEPVLWSDTVEDCEGELVLRHTLPPSGMVYYEVEPAH